MHAIKACAHNEVSYRVQLACFNEPEHAGPHKHIANMREITKSVFTGYCLFVPGCQTELLPDMRAT